MKTVTKKYALLMGISVCVLLQSQSKVALTHADHSQNPFGGKVAFRFDQEPIINYLPSSQDYTQVEQVVFLDKQPEGQTELCTKKELVFFLPLASVKHKKTQEFINQINVTKHLPYTMVVEPVLTPMQGLLCTVTFNPQEVGFQVESFLSPKGEPGIAFTFYLKDKLQTVLGNHDTIKKVAFASSSCSSSAAKKKYA